MDIIFPTKQDSEVKKKKQPCKSGYFIFQKESRVCVYSLGSYPPPQACAPAVREQVAAAASPELSLVREAHSRLEDLNDTRVCVSLSPGMYELRPGVTGVSFGELLYGAGFWSLSGSLIVVDSRSDFHFLVKTTTTTKKPR